MSVATQAAPASAREPRTPLFVLPGAARGWRANRFVAGWAVVWALVGCLVAAGIFFINQRREDLVPILTTSVLFAEVVGFTALLSARIVFPFFERLSFFSRFGLQTMTLFGGTVLGSIAVLASQPLYALANLRVVLVVVLVNAILAILTGFSIFTYDTMRRQIEASYVALREKERLEREVAIAREVQHELLPRFVPSVRGLELAGRCLPAVGVGGDYYDFVPLGDDRLAIVVADVSGKGIPAALLMAGLQGSVRSIALPTVPPAEVARRLNTMLHETTSDSRYATMFFAVWNGADSTLAYANAGHFPPLHLCGEGTVRLAAGGLPIGLLPGATYSESARRLAPGDLVAMYTDGVVEAPDAEGREFGEARLVEILERTRQGPLEEALDAVVDAVAAWKRGGDPHDDVTVVLARAS